LNTFRAFGSAVESAEGRGAAPESFWGGPLFCAPGTVFFAWILGKDFGPVGGNRLAKREGLL